MVEQRRQHQFPLHRPPHPNLGAGWYLITAATFEHRHHFSQANELTALTFRILEGVTEKGFPLAGWVVLPNHYHLLLELDDPKALGTTLGKVHGRSARYANLRDRSPGRQVWYKFSDRKVRSERHYWTCLNYILCNPLKHRYVEKLEDWPWSCFHELLAAHGNEWIHQLQRDYPLFDFGSGWDEFS